MPSCIIAAHTSELSSGAVTLHSMYVGMHLHCHDGLSRCSLSVGQLPPCTGKSGQRAGGYCFGLVTEHLPSPGLGLGLTHPLIGPSVGSWWSC